jgi:uncharacterized Zn-finger protein
MKPFGCDICNAHFSQNHKLQMHIRTVHEGERPFECHLCGNKYTSKQILDHHINRVHEGGKKPIPF